MNEQDKIDAAMRRARYTAGEWTRGLRDETRRAISVYDLHSLEDSIGHCLMVPINKSKDP